MNDESILGLYEQRSEEASAALYESYRGLIFGVAFSILRNAQDAEECVNDVLLAAWNAIPPRPDNLPAYVSKLARNAAISHYRTKNAEKRGGGELPLIFEELSECIPDPRAKGDPCADIALKSALARFVRSLPAETRRMFVKRYWYSWTVPEVAKAFGVSEGRVVMKLSRARKKLRRMLEEEDIRV